MKKTTSILATIMLLMVLFITSCKKTDDPAPTTQGTSASFSGNWYVSENSTINGPATYNVKLETPDVSSVVFAYLYGFHTKVNGTVSNNTFTIPTQIIEGNSVSGSGVLVNPNQINMQYFVFSGLSSDSVSVVLTK